MDRLSHPAKVSGTMPRIRDFMAHGCRAEVTTQAELYDWSIADPAAFWGDLLAWSDLRWEGSAQPALVGEGVETARFFPALTLNYADNILTPAFPGSGPVVTAVTADGSSRRFDRAALRDLVEHAAGGLRALGIVPGDRVVAVARNTVETIVAALAVSAVGAIFSSVAPDMGVASILDRLAPLEPVILFAHTVPRSSDAGPALDAKIAAVAAKLPGLRAVIGLDRAGMTPVLECDFMPWDRLLAAPSLRQQDWPRFAFDHPLFILFSSGTTGRAKAIVHGAGGTLLEHVKEHRLHCDLGEADRLFFQTSCSWMMWNWQLSALASGAEILVYDGAVEDPGTLWRIVDAHGVTQFGTSPAYLRMGEDAGFIPNRHHRLAALRAILSTGSVLFDAQFDWVAAAVKPVPLQSISGGTDILGCFMLGSPILPVIRGEAQCRSLGLDVRALGATAEEPTGELVCASPFPSRPIGLYGDGDGSRLHAAYFAAHLGLWTHGDLIEIGPAGGVRVHGRSDGVLNVRGIRIGPAEIYTVLAAQCPEVSAAIAVMQDAKDRAGEAQLVLVIVLREGVALDRALAARIRQALAIHATSAHVPRRILALPAFPMTYSGKASTAALADAINGRPVRNLAEIANPDVLTSFAPETAAPRAARPDAPTLADRSATTAFLRTEWERLFGVAPIGEDENFFSLGGDSLLATELFTAIAAHTGIDMPISTLLEAPALGQLADRLWRGPPHRGAQLVTLREGVGRPFFLIHSIAGTVLQFRNLQRHLRTGRPLIAVQSAGLFADDTPARCIVAMARDYVALIRSAQPHGPYSIGGYSLGGLIAFEIARQLRAEDQMIDPVVLIDPTFHARHLSPVQKTRYYHDASIQALRALRALPVRARADYLRDRFIHASGRRGAVSSQADGDPDLRLHRSMMTAWRDYAPAPFAGAALFIMPTTRLPFHSDRVWPKIVSGPIETRRIPGDHLAMIFANAPDLSREIDAYLATTAPG